MSLIRLKECAVPGCDHEFPEHYFHDVCGMVGGVHTTEEHLKYGNRFDRADAQKKLAAETPEAETCPTPR